MKCKKCGHELVENAKFCKYCGSPIKHIDSIEPKKCPRCGSDLKKGNKFCTQCGLKIVDNIQSNGQPESTKKNKFGKILIILCMFLIILFTSIALIYFLYPKIHVDKKKEIFNENIEEKEENNIGLDEEREYEDENDMYQADSTSDYIFEESQYVYLMESDLEDLTLQELNYAKNEIYERHGRKFKSKELQNYFESKLWYEGQYDPDDFDENYSSQLLNDYEKANAELISEKEHKLDPNGYNPN